MRPVLIKLGWLRVNAYGFMLMVGFAAGIAWGMREARRRRIAPDLVLDFGLWALLSAIVASRVVFVLLDLPAYLQEPLTMFQLWKGGLSFHGGLGGALLALYFFCRKRGLRFTQMTDLLAPALALGYAFARIGCFLNGCCYGVPTLLPWASRFLDEQLPGGVTPPSHPTQLYAAALSLALFGLLAWRGRYARFEGQVTLWYLAAYSVIRFAVEILRRGVTGKLFVLGMTEAQVASLVIFTLAVAALAVGMKRSVRSPASGGGSSRKRGGDSDRQRGT